MRSLLSLLIQDIIVGVSNKGSVVSVEEHLIRNLEANESFVVNFEGKKNGNLPENTKERAILIEIFQNHLKR